MTAQKGTALNPAPHAHHPRRVPVQKGTIQGSVTQAHPIRGAPAQKGITPPYRDLQARQPRRAHPRMDKSPRPPPRHALLPTPAASSYPSGPPPRKPQTVEPAIRATPTTTDPTPDASARTSRSQPLPRTSKLTPLQTTPIQLPHNTSAHSTPTRLEDRVHPAPQSTPT